MLFVQKFGVKELEDGEMNLNNQHDWFRVRQIWCMVPNKAFNMTHSLAVYGNEDTAKFNNFVVCMFPFLLSTDFVGH